MINKTNLAEVQHNARITCSNLSRDPAGEAEGSFAQSLRKAVKAQVAYRNGTPQQQAEQAERERSRYRKLVRRPRGPAD